MKCVATILVIAVIFTPCFVCANPSQLMVDLWAFKIFITTDKLIYLMRRGYYFAACIEDHTSKWGYCELFYDRQLRKDIIIEGGRVCQLYAKNFKVMGLFSSISAAARRFNPQNIACLQDGIDLGRQFLFNPVANKTVSPGLA